jgi:hypothetical protein
MCRIECYISYLRCSSVEKSFTVKDWKNRFNHKIIIKLSWNNISQDSRRPATFTCIFRIFLGYMADFLRIFMEINLSEISIDRNSSVWDTNLVVWCFIIVNWIPIHYYNISQIEDTFEASDIFKLGYFRHCFLKIYRNI